MRQNVPAHAHWSTSTRKACITRSQRVRVQRSPPRPQYSLTRCLHHISARTRAHYMAGHRQHTHRRELTRTYACMQSPTAAARHSGSYHALTGPLTTHTYRHQFHAHAQRRTRPPIATVCSCARRNSHRSHTVSGTLARTYTLTRSARALSLTHTRIFSVRTHSHACTCTHAHSRFHLIARAMHELTHTVTSHARTRARGTLTHARTSPLFFSPRSLSLSLSLSLTHTRTHTFSHTQHTSR